MEASVTSNIEQALTTLKDTESIDQAYPFIYLEKAPEMPGSQDAKQLICQAKGLSMDASHSVDGWSLSMHEKI